MQHQHIEAEELTHLQNGLVEFDHVFLDDLGVDLFIQILGTGLNQPCLDDPAVDYLQAPNLFLVILGLQNIDFAVIDHAHGVDAQIQVFPLDIFVLERDLQVLYVGTDIQHVELPQYLIGHFRVGLGEAGDAEK